MRTKEVIITLVALLLLFIVGTTLAHYNYWPTNDFTIHQPDKDSDSQ